MKPQRSSCLNVLYRPITMFNSHVWNIHDCLQNGNRLCCLSFGSFFLQLFIAKVSWSFRHEYSKMTQSKNTMIFYETKKVIPDNWCKNAQKRKYFRSPSNYYMYISSNKSLFPVNGWPSCSNELVFRANGWPSHLNRLVFRANGWPSHSNELVFWANGWTSCLNELVFRSNGWPSRSNGLVFWANGWPNHSNRCKFFFNGLQTVKCKRNPAQKRKVVKVRFPVYGHIS